MGAHTVFRRKKTIPVSHNAAQSNARSYWFSGFESVATFRIWVETLLTKVSVVASNLCDLGNDSVPKPVAT